MAVKRNLKALRRLREVFKKVPADNVHMHVIEEETKCGTAHCLFGWGRQDEKLRAMGMSVWLHEAGPFFGLTYQEHNALFFDDHPLSMLKVFKHNPHTITKRQVMSRLDAAIAGKPIKPYVVKSP